MAVAVFQTKQVEGEVIFTARGSSVRVEATFTKLPKGEHGFHIHKAGDLRGEGCSGACDHWNKGPPQSHGGAPGETHQRHTGDLGNIELLPASGTFKKTYFLHRVAIPELWGRSVIVHADPDDLGQGEEEDSHTTGHSGKRIACAIIGRQMCSHHPPQLQSASQPSQTRKLRR